MLPVKDRYIPHKKKIFLYTKIYMYEKYVYWRNIRYIIMEIKSGYLQFVHTAVLKLICNHEKIHIAIYTEEKVLKKKITVLICALTAGVMLLAACGKPQAKDNASAGAQPNPSSSDDMTVIAEMDGQPVYMKDFNKWFNLVSTIGAETANDGQTALDDYLTYKVTYTELQSKGYMNLTADQISEAQGEVADGLGSYEEQSGLTEQEALADLGFSKDELTDEYKFLTAQDAAKTSILGDVKPTEDQIKTQYDTNVSDDKTAMDADPTQYVTNVADGTTVYYVPAGVRMVKRILIGLDDATVGAIQTLRDAGYDTQADFVLNDGLSKIKDKADALASQITSGQLTFDQALEQYPDKNMSAEGYPVVTGSTVHGDVFTQKAMALANIGDKSDMFTTDEGYQIIQYVSDKPQGSVNYDDVKDQITSDLQQDVTDTAWQAQVDQWKTDHKVTPHYETME